MDLPVIQLADVQANVPDIPITLSRVGVTEVKKLVEVARAEKRPIILISKFDIFVDLPSNRKGANLSRNFEAIDEVLEESLTSPVCELEELCSEVARRLLDRHEYASRAEVKMKSEYIVKRTTPVNKVKCQEVVDIFAEATADRKANGSVSVKKMVGAEVVGITACPCAQEIIRDKAITKLKELNVDTKTINEFLSVIPMATHNQRGRGIITIQVSNESRVSIEKIIRIIEESMSSSIYELLKRNDEALLVETAHKNPKFVEDCVRTMAKKLVQQFPDLPGDSVLTIKQINEESIHSHNALAERIATLSELKTELGIA